MPVDRKEPRVRRLSGTIAIEQQLDWHRRGGEVGDARAGAANLVCPKNGRTREQLHGRAHIPRWRVAIAIRRIERQLPTPGARVAEGTHGLAEIYKPCTVQSHLRATIMVCAVWENLGDA